MVKDLEKLNLALQAEKELTQRLQQVSPRILSHFLRNYGKKKFLLRKLKGNLNFTKKKRQNFENSLEHRKRESVMILICHKNCRQVRSTVDLIAYLGKKL